MSLASDIRQAVVDIIPALEDLKSIVTVNVPTMTYDPSTSSNVRVDNSIDVDAVLVGDILSEGTTNSALYDRTYVVFANVKGIQALITPLLTHLPTSTTITDGSDIYQVKVVDAFKVGGVDTIYIIGVVK